MQSTLLVHIQSGIATLTLNRPEKNNALNKDLVVEMTQQLLSIDQNPEVRVLILQAAGKDFCAGADLNWLMDRGNADKASFEANAPQLLANLMWNLHQFSKPTIALVQGNTYGGGLGLIACCDMAIISATASFCFSEVKLGLIPAIIAPYCIAAMGRRAAHYYFLSAEIFNADEAYRLGLIQQITQPGDLHASGQKLATTLLANSPQAMKATKRLINGACLLPDKDFFTTKTAEWLIAQQTSDEAQEGFRAFTEKRKPSWS
jgi:methylglutaconyl-CoA hydratase